MPPANRLGSSSWPCIPTSLGATAIALEHHEPLAHAHLGTLLSASGRHVEAVAALATALAQSNADEAIAAMLTQAQQALADHMARR